MTEAPAELWVRPRTLRNGEAGPVLPWWYQTLLRDEPDAVRYVREDMVKGDERRLAELAAYHVGLFAGAAGRIDATPAAIADALFLLIGEAERRRMEWLGARDVPGLEPLGTDYPR